MEDLNVVVEGVAERRDVWLGLVRILSYDEYCLCDRRGFFFFGFLLFNTRVQDIPMARQSLFDKRGEGYINICL